MSRPVDRDARRQVILDGFLRYVADVGLPAATSRGLARELGMAAGALWKYFDSFEEVVVEAFRYSFRGLFERLEANQEVPGLAGLEATVSMLLPFTPEAEFEARVALGYMGFRGKYVDLINLEGEMERVWAHHLRLHLESAQDHGELVDGIDVAELTEMLLVTVIGLQMQWAVPNSFNRSPARQRAILRQFMAPWLRVPGNFFAAEAEAESDDVDALTEPVELRAPQPRSDIMTP